MNYTLEEQRVLIIERASVNLKRLIIECIVNGIMLDVLKRRALQIRDETVVELRNIQTDEEYISDFKQGFVQSFMRWYRLFTLTLTKADNKGVMKHYFKALKGNPNENTTLVFAKDGIKKEVLNLREFLPESETGEASTYVDYVGRIKQAMNNVVGQIADGSLSIVDSKGRSKSLRNMAEIYTRYQLINDDMKKLGNNKFLIASAHSNASERCSHWQGKIFLNDFDVATREMGSYNEIKAKAKKPLGKIDGKEYYSLKYACECGFLSYNCRHRLVAYKAGMYIPQYDSITVEKKRNLENKQRYIERQIRKQKTLEVIGLTPEERNEARNKSKSLKTKYEDFCSKNKLIRYDWRTRISEVERELEGLK